MQFYEFIHRDSIIHKLDPRTKLLWVIMLTLAVFMTSNTYIILGLFVFTILTIFIGKLPLKNIWAGSKLFIIAFPIAFSILFSLLLWDLREGISGGLIFAIKFLIIIFSTIIFFMSTSPRDFVSSLTKLKIPYEIAFMLTLAITFVPVVIKEFNHVIEAQKARAYKFKISLLHPIKTMKSFIPVLIPTLMLLFKRPLDMALSIESRAFRASKKRTTSPRLKIKSVDYLAIAILIILFILLWIHK